jgi:hypothetical protein
MPDQDVAFIRAFLREICYSEPKARALYATMMSRMRRSHFADIAEPPSDAAERIAAILRSDGIAELGALIGESAVADIHGYFRARPTYAGHVVAHSDGVPRALDETRRISHYGCYARDDVVHCPHLVEIANDPQLLAIAEAYLGCPPTIYSLHAWWSFAQSGTAAKFSQDLHRDMDELKFVTLFIYLTPVDAETGAHRYIRHSHDTAILAKALTALGWQQSAIDIATSALFCGPGYEVSGTADELLGQLATVWTGPAGSAALADTYGLHMGVPLVRGARLMAWVRYGLGILPEPEFGGGSGKYAAMLNTRIPQTARAKYVNRLLLTD